MPTELGVGSKAPAFALRRAGGGSVALADFKGRKLVIYFYPKADTPGCTREAIDFSRLRSDFQRAGADVLGVSADPVEAQGKFSKKHGLKIALLSNESHKMLEAYGVWGEKSMYGRTFMGITRATFLIGPDGESPAFGRRSKSMATPPRCLRRRRRCRAEAATPIFHGRFPEN